MSQRRAQFVYGQLLWMLGAIVGLSMVGAFSLEIFFFVTFLGFLILTELTTPSWVTPRWRTRLRWLVVVGTIISLVIVSESIIPYLRVLA